MHECLNIVFGLLVLHSVEMLDWLQKDHKVLGNVSVVITLLLAAWQIYRTRYPISSGLRAVSDWIWNLVSADYRDVYQKRKLKRIKAKARYLFHFSHNDEMECLSKIYSRLSFALMLLLYGAVIGISSFFLVVMWGLSMLEKEILHQPIKPVTHQGGSSFVFTVSFTLMFLMTLWSISNVGANAYYLSRRNRLRTIKKLRKNIQRLTAQSLPVAKILSVSGGTVPLEIKPENAAQPKTHIAGQS